MTHFLIALLLGFAAALVGGIISGITLAGKALGNEVAGSLGGVYGLLSGATAVVLGLILLAIF